MTNKRNIAPYRREEIPRKLLIDEVRRIAKILVKVPTMRDFDAHSQIGRAVTCEKKFRGWNSFLAAAGFEPGSSRQSISSDDLRSEFARIASMLGRTPTTDDFNANKRLGSSSTIALRFGGGNWDKACRTLGFVPPRKSQPPKMGGWNKGIKRAKVNLDQLRQLYEIEGLSMSSIAAKLKVGVNTVRRRMDEAGIVVRRHHYTQPVQTLPETLLYNELEKQRVPFMKQQPIDGFYVVDALVPGAKIAIEVDGDYWHRQTDPNIVRRDRKKTKYLESRGYIVFRFTETGLKTDASQCVDRVSAIWRQYKK
jgi:very-short-patch-repair endonuclease